jgi:hypothetical protein
MCSDYIQSQIRFSRCFLYYSGTCDKFRLDARLFSAPAMLEGYLNNVLSIYLSLLLADLILTVLAAINQKAF